MFRPARQQGSGATQLKQACPKLGGMFIGVIQALIFSLLTIVYFSFAVNEGGH